MAAPENPLDKLMPLVEDLVSVLIARDYKSAELTAQIYAGSLQPVQERTRRALRSVS